MIVDVATVAVAALNRPENVPLVAEIIVAVALVNVAFPAVKKFVFVVVAFVVEAFSTSELIDEVALMVPALIT